MQDLSYIDKSIMNLQEKKKKVEELFKRLGMTLSKDNNEGNFSKEFTLKASSLKELKVAAVMDRFTLDSYAPECQLIELTPTHWKNEIDTFEPDLIFIESAWKGKEDLWYRKIANGSKEYFEMTSYCQDKNIPIVFWNKEDPVYTDTFMNAARMADVVFTTDIDCINKYKKNLKHDHVYHLHFAAQPKIHNPIEKYDRKDKYCFAGAYYHKYKNRCKVFDEFSKFFIETKGYDIYDRNYKNALPEHAFPKIYNNYILGKLDPSEIDKAYKGYHFGINMNSVEQSQTMFARRVFEMLASNTVTIGNYSRGVKNYFGDLTICTNDATTLKRYIENWCSSAADYRKYRLLGLRKVLSQHLYEDRLAYIVKKVFGKQMESTLPMIHIGAQVETQEELQYVINQFNKQTYSNKKLYIKTSIKDDGIANDHILIAEHLSDFKIAEAHFYTVFSANNYYGENYLLDLALNTRYGAFKGIGKANYYKKTADGIISPEGADTYKSVEQLKLDRCIVQGAVLPEKSLEDLLETESICEKNLFCVDEFNFCEGYVGEQCEAVDDLKIEDQGISLKEIEEIAEGIQAEQFSEDGLRLNENEIYEYIKRKNNPKVTISKANGHLMIESTLSEEVNDYIDIQKTFNVEDFRQGDKLGMLFQGVGDLDSIATCIFYDQYKKKISPAFDKLNKVFEIDIPKNAVYFKLSLRIKGSGQLKLKEVVVGATQIQDEKSCFLSRSNILVLTNQYPSKENLYRNMFVHKRVMAYKESGLKCDVMRMNIYAKEEYSEFEGINIVEGQAQMLSNLLENGKIDTVCVHFLDRQMWEVLKGFKDKVRIIVWVHGAEIQPWWRREYNYNTAEELEKAKKDSEVRMAFWAEVFKEINNYNIQFVFVSQYFAEEIFEDNKLQLSKDKYSIIHNCIDTEMFTYEEKSEEQRKKFLSIRPYASNKYANDLTVKAILELSKKPYFNELEFRMIGNGELFDETLKPLKKFKNVHIEKKFLRQEEIARLHKEYGVFITPTRMDAQGVSRDEAMSSGLVAITNAVTAIPEFVDPECGVLVPGEDYKAMAEGMEKLFKEPAYFKQLSNNAAKRVRTQTSKEFTIDKEINLINQ